MATHYGENMRSCRGSLGINGPSKHVLGCAGKFGSMFQGSYNLLINGVFSGYNPFTNIYPPFTNFLGHSSSSVEKCRWKSLLGFPGKKPVGNWFLSWFSSPIYGTYNLLIEITIHLLPKYHGHPNIYPGKMETGSFSFL